MDSSLTDAIPHNQKSIPCDASKNFCRVQGEKISHNNFTHKSHILFNDKL